MYESYGLPSIDFSHCFQKTKELSPNDSPYHTMAVIALTTLSKINSSQHPINEIVILDLHKLPEACKAPLQSHN